MHDDARFHQLMSDQHGFALRRQALECGLDHRWVKRRVDRGDLIADGPQLLRSATAPLTRHARRVAAVLESGDDSGLGFSAGAAFWGVPGFPHEPTYVIRPRGRRIRPLRYGEVRGTRCLPPEHLMERRGLRVTTPTRTLFDLAIDCPQARLERAVDAMWSLRLADGPRLHRMLEEIRRSGRDGIEHMEALLEVRGPDWVPPESGLESRFHQLLRDDDQRPMRIQVKVGDDDQIGRVDAVDDEAAVIVEIQSERFHGSPSDVAADAVRHARLREAGWEVVEVWDHEVFLTPGPMLERVRRTRRARPRRAA
jgi:very-short-patch-repair endonuclease